MMSVICIFNLSENLWNILYNSISKDNGMIVEKIALQEIEAKQTNSL